MHAIADLFCELYDGIDEAVFRTHFHDWSGDRFLGSTTLGVANEVRSGGSVAGIRDRLDASGDREATRYACLRGIDSALMSVNPALQGKERTPAALEPLAAHVLARGRLDSGAHGGALLLRHVSRFASGVEEHQRDAFAAVVRVPDASWRRCEHVVLGPSSAIWRRDLEPGLKVACLPFIADPREMVFETRDLPAGRCYFIGPRSLPATRERVAQALAALDGSGAAVGILPELTLDGPLLDIWQRALRARRSSRLRWVLVGTGNLAGGRPAGNTAVLLHGRTGEVIARQEKLFPFNLTRNLLRRWKLTGRLGEEALAEDLLRGEWFTVIEAGALRVAILVCEDLARVTDLSVIVRDLGVSHLLVPVFGRPLRDHRWEHNAADVYGQATGSTAVIANSLVMQSIIGSGSGTCLLVGPAMEKPLVGASASPTELSCFLLAPDGTATLV